MLISTREARRAKIEELQELLKIADRVRARTAETAMTASIAVNMIEGELKRLLMEEVTPTIRKRKRRVKERVEP